MKTKTTNEKAIKALIKDGWNDYVTWDVLKTAPENEGKLELFNLGKYISVEELEKEYESRGLTPASPSLVAEYVTENPGYKEKCVATQWKDEEGKFCYLTCYLWYDERHVDVYRNVYDWDGRWWFAGLRKSELGTKSLETPMTLGTLPFDELLEKVKKEYHEAYEKGREDMKKELMDKLK